MSDAFILISLPVPEEADNPVTWRVGLERRLAPALLETGGNVSGGGTLFDPEAGAIAEIFVYGEPLEPILTTIIAFFTGDQGTPPGTRVELYTDAVAQGATSAWTKRA